RPCLPLGTLSSLAGFESLNWAAPSWGRPILFSARPAIAAAMAGLAVVLLSGGLDSMVAAGLARAAGFRLLALTIDYNQRHRIELEAAARIAAQLGAERHLVLPLDLTGFGGSALTADIDVPKGGVEGGV